MTVRFLGNSWWFDFQIRGVRYRERIPEARLKPQALVVEAKARDDVFNNRYNPQQKGNIHFSEFVEKVYKPWVEANNKAPYDARCTATIFCKYFKGKTLSEMTRGVIAEWRDKRASEITERKRVRAKSTVNREMARLSRIMSLAEEYEYIEYNPCRKVKRYTTDSQRRAVLARADEPKLFEKLEGDREHLATIARLILNTGMRRGELLKSRVSFLDFTIEKDFAGRTTSIGKISLPGYLEIGTQKIRVTKTGRSRVIPMNKVARQILFDLAEGLEPDKKIFHGIGYSLSSISHRFSQACCEAKLPDICLHILRHTFATRLAGLGVHPFTIRDLLGHSSGAKMGLEAMPEMTARYVHSEFETMKKAVDLLCEEKGEVVSFERQIV